MPAIPLADIMIDSLDTIMAAPDGGLRLTDVYLDISAWDYAKTKDFIDLLTSDRLKGTQLDVNGNYVSVDDTNEETWYPIISGVLKVNNDIVDDALDTLLTRITLRYPSLYIKQPDVIKDFSYCKWFEIQSVCAAAKNGTLYDGFDDLGNPHMCSIEDVWEPGETKNVTMNDGVNIQIVIAGFNQALDVYNETIPLTLMTKQCYPSDQQFGYDLEAKYLFNLKIDGEVVPISEKDGVAEYTYTGSEKKDIRIDFFDRSYIDRIYMNHNSKMWYFNNKKASDGSPASDMTLSQQAIQKDSFIKEVQDYVIDSVIEWIPSNQLNNKLILDGSNGAIHIYNRKIDEPNIGTSKDVEFKGGSAIIIPQIPPNTKFQIYATAVTGAMGYNKSTLRSLIESEAVWGNFPEGLKNIIKTAKVYSNIGRLSSEVEFAELKLYPLSIGDFKKCEFYYAGERQQEELQTYLKERGTERFLELFTPQETDTDTSNVMNGYGERNYPWFTRSSSVARTGFFNYITREGGMSQYSNTNQIYYLITRFNI